MIRITSKKDGFRRCGVAHSSTPTEYSDGFFTYEQLAQLRAEPMLVVELCPELCPGPLPAEQPPDQRREGEITPPPGESPGDSVRPVQTVEPVEPPEKVRRR